VSCVGDKEIRQITRDRNYYNNKIIRHEHTVTQTQEDADQPNYVTSRINHLHNVGTQQHLQKSELPAEYVRLLQDIALQQQHQNQNIQSTRPNVRYVTEEEYTKIVNNQRPQDAVPEQQDIENPNRFILSLDTHTDPHTFYQQSRVLNDFDKELTLLVESNKPLQYEAPRNRLKPIIGSRPSIAPLQQFNPTNNNHALKLKFSNPANIQFSQKRVTPAQQYQVLGFRQEQNLQSNPVLNFRFYVPKEKQFQHEKLPTPEPFVEQGTTKVVESSQHQSTQTEDQKNTSLNSGDQLGKLSGRQGVIYVSRTNQGPPLPKIEKSELPPLKLKNDRPLTKAEFQALLDLGYNLIPIHVPVPYQVQITRRNQPEKVQNNKIQELQ